MHRTMFTRLNFENDAVQGGQWLRLRDEGGKTTLTLKQVTDATHINGTTEIEVEVDDLEATAEVAVARTAKGIPVAPKVWRELTESAQKFGITPPGAA